MNQSFYRPITRLLTRGKRIRLGERTLIMGVVNVTPDSFSDGGLYLDPKKAVAHAVELARQGADWIDVGGESTRPGSKSVSAEEEAERVLPVIRGIHRRLPELPISIDTQKSQVAELAIEAGASILNDVSGLRFDPALADVARRHRAPLILMHLRGRPETMQKRPFARSIWRSLEQGIETSIRRALDNGVRRSQLIIDPGLGFGKSRAQNYEIVKHLNRLQAFGLPILTGSSRKSFVRASMQTSPSVRAVREPPLPESDGASALQLADAAFAVAAILNGAHIIRVHDVEHTLPAVRLADAILHS